MAKFRSESKQPRLAMLTCLLLLIFSLLILSPASSKAIARSDQPSELQPDLQPAPPTGTYLAPFGMPPAACPPTSCTAGKDVGEEFMQGVLQKMNIPVTQFAVDALMSWKPYEGTKACWNPFATKWQMSEVCDFNYQTVQDFQNQEMGMTATANTLNLDYYIAIRTMLRKEGFDREAIRKSLSTWGTCKAERCDNLLNTWQKLYDESAACSAPLLLQPADGFETEISSLAFSWQESSCPGAGHYYFRVGTQDGEDDVLAPKLVSELSTIQFFDLKWHNRDLYWSVRAETDGSAWSGSYQFRIDHPCEPGSRQIALYQDADYAGPCVVKGIGSYTDVTALGLHDDAISSLKVGSSVQVTLCSETNLAGNCEIFKSDDPSLVDNTIGDDRVSSLKVALRVGDPLDTNWWDSFWQNLESKWADFWETQKDKAGAAFEDWWQGLMDKWTAQLEIWLEEQTLRSLQMVDQCVGSMALIPLAVGIAWVSRRRK